ncbi:MAG TPA: transglycosylase SLT domain-containing protein [Gemmatimonadaceae bacterium]|nr:transglycosylase SLT domain-containing protein [Gemmatimonadaceae bacterium]
MYQIVRPSLWQSAVARTRTALLFALSAACFDPNDARERPSQHPVRAGVIDLRWAPHVGLSRPAGGEDSVVAAAEASLRGGRPWRATQMLAPVLGNASSRTPRAVIVAARAAAAWQGWDEVVRLLLGEPWLDAFAGEGDALLARAVLETNRRDLDSVALRHARRAVASSPDSDARAARLVVLARAFTRVGQSDSARVAWEGAARSAPGVADWLLLQAALLTPSPSDREALFARLTTDVARGRTPWIEAEARERAGDLAGATLLLDSLGARVDALRVRLSMAHGTEDRSSVRRELNAIVASRRGSPPARQAAALLDGVFAPLTAREQLAIARSAARVGPVSRAAAGFAAAFAAGLGTAADRYAYGQMLATLGRHHDAIGQFQQAARSGSLTGRAQYQRARSLLRSGQLAESRSALRAIVRADHDPASTASALFLLADLATDEGRDAAARAAFLELVRRYPASALSPRAAFRAAMIAYVHDSLSRAAMEFDALRARHARSNEALAATYWAGRAWQRAGDSARANDRWRGVLAREPHGYYATLARARTRSPLADVPSGVAVASDPAVDSVMARAALLEQLGLSADARREYDHVERDARRSFTAALTAAAAFLTHDQGGRTIRLAAGVLRHAPAPDAALYHLVYPLPYEETIRFESGVHGVEPALVAALIRQESSFFPSATSAVGARGLMQIMPAVGRQSAIARSAVTWSDALLYQPDVSLRLGTAHLAALLARYNEPARALAAYNAGESRVDRWARKAGASDPEVFVERIPYVETRDYVRIVLRNMTWYRRLYAL